MLFTGWRRKMARDTLCVEKGMNEEKREVVHLLRVNPCNRQSDYGQHYLGVQLLRSGNNCRNNYKWVTRIGALNRYDFTSWVAESPDGTYILAVGTTNIQVGGARRLARVITKLDSTSGAIIWSATLPTTDNLGQFQNS